jgi:hypothetical protein
MESAQLTSKHEVHGWVGHLHDHGSGGNQDIPHSDLCSGEERRTKGRGKETAVTAAVGIYAPSSGCCRNHTTVPERACDGMMLLPVCSTQLSHPCALCCAARGDFCHLC